MWWVVIVLKQGWRAGQTDITRQECSNPRLYQSLGCLMALYLVGSIQPLFSTLRLGLPHAFSHPMSRFALCPELRYTFSVAAVLLHQAM